jgi:sterol desaturase/sphingolipid hydroxylase (fatty acid hydroxylase superfamily)
MTSLGIIRYALPAFTILILLEIYLYRRRGLRFPHREALISLAVAFLYPILNFLGALLVSPWAQAAYDLRPWTVPLNTWWGIALLFLGVEFFYYWLHRCAHEIRWMWASHSVHHSPHTMTFSGAYRLGVTGILSGLFIFFFPLYLLGFEPKAVAAMFSVNLIYQFWLHTDLIPKLGWFEGIFNTPSHHRVHHASEEIYIDRNYGGVLIIFDRLFGTFQEEKAELPCTYGLIGKKKTLNLFRVLFQEWGDIARDAWQARSPKELYLATFGRPGSFALAYRARQDSLSVDKDVGLGKAEKQKTA